jgi:hypothetical protein
MSEVEQDVFVCFFLAPQEGLSDQFKNMFALSRFIAPSSIPFNVSVNIYRPDKVQEVSFKQCSAYGVPQHICSKRVLPKVYKSIRKIMATVNSNLFASGIYKNRPKLLTVFLHDNVKAKLGTDLFFSVVSSKSNTHLTDVLRDMVHIGLKKRICQDFHIQEAMCNHLSELINRANSMSSNFGSLMFRQVNEAAFVTMPYDNTDEDLYTFCLTQQCHLKVFYAMNTFLDIQRRLVDKRKHRQSMTVIGLNAGTDKVFWHGYQKHYKRSIETYRNRPVRLLEIGLRDGASLELWSKYFHPDSEIFGIDFGSIDQNCSPCNIHGALCFHGDQENVTFLNLVLERSGGNFDIIIDDGGHGYGQQMSSFSVLFDKGLKPGGLYFIEDIETSYWTNYEQYGNIINGGKNHMNAPLTTFLQMVHVINREFHNHSDSVLFPLDRLVESVGFSHNLVEIVKRERYPDYYDDRPYRYAYTMDRYGGALKPIPSKYNIREEHKEAHLAIELSTINPEMAPGPPFAKIFFDRFTSHDAVSLAMAQLCLQYSSSNFTLRLQCTNKLLKSISQALVNPNEPFLHDTKEFKEERRFEQSKKDLLEGELMVKCQTLHGDIESICYVPKMCRVQGRLAVVERNRLPKELLEMLPPNIPALSWEQASKLRVIKGAAYIGRGSYGFAHTMQDFFPALSIMHHAQSLGIPEMRHLILTGFAVPGQHKSMPWINEFLEAIKSIPVQVWHGWKEFDDVGGVCFVGIVHRNMSGTFTWKNTGWLDPIDWLQSVEIGRIISKEVSEKLQCSSQSLNRKGGTILFLQRQGESRHVLGVQDLFRAIPFDPSRPPQTRSFEGTSLCYQIETIQNADVIIAPHGAGLTNLIFAHECTAVVELFPYNYYIPGFYGALAQQRGLAYAAWYDADPVKIPSCMKPEWNSPDICHLSPACRSCARGANMTLRKESQFESILFSISKALELQAECRFKSQENEQTKASMYAWIPSYSRFGFREDRTLGRNPIQTMFEKIAVETIVGDVVHVGYAKTGFFLGMAKKYLELYQLHHVRVCIAASRNKEAFCIRYVSPSFWEEDTVRRAPDCISLLHIHSYYEDVFPSALNTYFDQVSVGGFIHLLGEGDIEKSPSILRDIAIKFIWENNLQGTTSITRHLYDSMQDGDTFSWRRWVRSPKSFGRHWCGRTSACRKRMQFSLLGSITLDTKRANKLQQELCYNQFKPGKKEIRLFHVGSGIGSFIHHVSMAHAIAYDMHRKLVVTPNSDGYFGFHNYTDCPKRDLTCYFDPMWHAPGNGDHCTPFNETSSGEQSNVSCLSLSYHRFALLGETGNFRGNFNSPAEFIPDKLIDQKDGLLFVRSQLEWFILQPNTYLHCAIMLTKLAVNVQSHDFIAAHIRHGDKATESKTFHLEKYISPLRAIAEKKKIRSVFVSTEDQHVIDALCNYPQFEFYFTKHHKRLNANIETALKDGKTTAKSEALIAFRNLFIAAGASTFLGTFSSNWGRLVYELMYASHGSAHTDFYSLDVGYMT